MKTKETIFKTQITLLLYIIFPLITGMSSCQKDKTLDINITEFEWELNSITDDGNKVKRPSGDFHRDDAYILRFSDSTFVLNTTVNSAGGHYKIITKGEINILSYGVMTMVCCETDFDEKMISVFKGMTSYTVKGKTLTFKGDNSEVEFKKK